MANPTGKNQFSGGRKQSPAIGLSTVRAALKASMFTKNVSNSGMVHVAMSSPMTKKGTRSKKFPLGYLTQHQGSKKK